MKRSHVNKHSDKKHFSNTARKTHKRNIPRNPMRGGIRL